MSTHSPSVHGHDVSRHDLERGNHQEDAVDFSGILKAGAGLTIMTVLTYFVVWGAYKVLVKTTDAVSTTRQYPMAIGQENRVPPEPRLQTDPKQELKDLRAAEADTLAHYGWVDKNNGVVRIPIESAIKLTLERGLPSRETTSVAPTPAPAAAVPAVPTPAPDHAPAHGQDHR